MNPAERDAIEERHVQVFGKTMEPDPADPSKMRVTTLCRWCASRRPDDDFRWPCETHRLLAALRAAEGRALPSVERLAVAMGSTGNCGHSSCPRDTSRHDDEAAAILAALATDDAL